MNIIKGSNYYINNNNENSKEKFPNKKIFIPNFHKKKKNSMKIINEKDFIKDNKRNSLTLNMNKLILNENKIENNNLSENKSTPLKKKEITKSINFNKVLHINETYSGSDIGEVGEIIEDDAESELTNNLNEFGDNNIINNAKKIQVYSSYNFEDIKYKIQSLSVSKKKSFSKINENDINSLKKNIFDNIEKDFYKNQKIQQAPKINEINKKILTKDKDIEKFQKKIENLKKRIKKYDNEIQTVNNWIKIEEEKRDNFQQMISFLNNK